MFMSVFIAIVIKVHINQFNTPTLSKLMGSKTVMVQGQNDDGSTLGEWLSTPQG